MGATGAVIPLKCPERGLSPPPDITVSLRQFFNHFLIEKCSNCQKKWSELLWEGFLIGNLLPAA